MLDRRQFVVCAALASAFWMLATLCIRLRPASVAAGLEGDFGFLASIPVGWLCVRLICRVARLEPNQILAGCLVVIGDCMLIDGIALRWFHFVYAPSEQISRSGAAWLLWGYGISVWIALFVAGRRLRDDDGQLIVAAEQR